MTDLAYWDRRWQEGRTGWHVRGVNPMLRRWWDHLALPAGARVLVPLAGRSDDLLWLARRGYQVTGVESCARPIAQLFQQAGLNPRRHQRGCGVEWQHRNLRVWQGDFFRFEAEPQGRFQAIYDRAALIALPPHQRPDYVRQVMALSAPGARQLLITLDYSPELREGPPYSVGPAEVFGLYGAHAEIQPLAKRPENDLPQVEHVFRILRR